MLDVRKDFPYLERMVHDQPIVYFDNAATTQKPLHVINRMCDLYTTGMSNVHRALNFLADEVTQAYETSRETVARFIGAQAREIVFVSNATQAINVVCSSLSQERPLHVLTTTLEHHSNLLPWVTRGKVDFLPWDKDGQVDWKTLDQKLAEKPDLVAVTRASNFLGVLFPVAEIAAKCRQAGVPVLVDASQAIAHEAIDVRELQCDYLVFSGHKIYGPGGTGVLYMRHDVMERMQPVFLGGSMVKEVHAETYTVNDLPYRFEAGTPNIEGVIGLAAALEYLSQLSLRDVAAHESALVQYAKDRLADVQGVQMYGPPAGVPCAPLMAWHVKGLEPTAIAKVLANRANIIVRSGFHCAQPAHDHLGIGPTVRASFAIYNTIDEIDSMIDVLQSLTRVLV